MFVFVIFAWRTEGKTSLSLQANEWCRDAFSDFHPLNQEMRRAKSAPSQISAFRFSVAHLWKRRIFQAKKAFMMLTVNWPEHQCSPAPHVGFFQWNKFQPHSVANWLLTAPVSWLRLSVIVCCSSTGGRVVVWNLCEWNKIFALSFHHALTFDIKTKIDFLFQGHTYALDMMCDPATIWNNNKT